MKGCYSDAGLPGARGAEQRVFLCRSIWKSGLRGPRLLLSLQMQTNRTHYCFGPVKTKGVSSFLFALLTVSAPYPVTVTTENDLGKRDPIMRPK